MYRDIFREARRIAQYTAENDLGVAIEGRPIHLFIDKTLKEARDICFRDPECAIATTYPEAYKYIYDIKQTPDYFILATLAISAAHREASLFVIYDHPMNLSKAYGLLKEADKCYRNANLEEMDSELEKAAVEITNLMPLAEQRRQYLAKNKQTAEEKSQASKDWHNIIGIWHDKIKADSRSNITNKKIAKKIHEGIQNTSFPLSEIESLEDGFEPNSKDSKYPTESTINKVLSLVRPRKKK